MVQTGIWSINEVSAQHQEVTGFFVNEWPEVWGNAAWTTNRFVAGQYIYTTRFSYTAEMDDFVHRGTDPVDRYAAAQVCNDSYFWVTAGVASGGASVVNNITRHDYKNDSAVGIDRADSNTKHTSFNNVSSTTKGYCLGTFQDNTTYTNVIEAYTLATDTINSVDRADMTEISTGSQGVQNASFGWSMGGLTTASAVINTIQRLDYASDTTDAADRADTLTKTYQGDNAHNATYAWAAGGENSGRQNTIERYTFASDTSDSVDRSDLPQRQYNNTSGSGNDVSAYFGVLDDGCKMPFANDTIIPIFVGEMLPGNPQPACNMRSQV